MTSPAQEPRDAAGPNFAGVLGAHLYLTFGSCSCGAWQPEVEEHWSPAEPQFPPYPHQHRAHVAERLNAALVEWSERNVPKVQIERNLGEPTLCRVTLDGRTIFAGQDYMSADQAG